MKNTLLPSLILLSVGALAANAQISTTDMTGMTGMDLANALIDDPSITIDSATYTGDTGASGTFANGTASVGFGSGVVLTTGSVSSISGTNTSDSISTNLPVPGDTDLNGLIPGTTNDASILEIIFTPVSDTISFQFMFASEEYNEYVNSAYNDVFGFFLNGVNIALIPGTSTAIAINNINNVLNSAHYLDNDPSDTAASHPLEYDGLVGYTIPLYATGAVTPGVQNTIKLAIADAGDSSLDSAVFLKGGSFTNAPPPTNNAVPEPSTYGILGALALAGLIVGRRFRR